MNAMSDIFIKRQTVICIFSCETFMYIVKDLGLLTAEFWQ